MNIWRILTGKLSISYLRTQKITVPRVYTYWGGRLFYLSIGRVNIILDCRVDLWEDMRTGEIK